MYKLKYYRQITAQMELDWYIASITTSQKWMRAHTFVRCTMSSLLYTQIHFLGMQSATLHETTRKIWTETNRKQKHFTKSFSLLCFFSFSSLFVNSSCFHFWFCFDDGIISHRMQRALMLGEYHGMVWEALCWVSSAREQVSEITDDTGAISYLTGWYLLVLLGRSKYWEV